MKLSAIELTELANLAIDAATAAGKMIARSRPKQIEHKSTGGSLASQVVTEVDRRSEASIVETLTPTLERFEDDRFAASVDFGNHLRRETAAAGLVLNFLWPGASDHLTRRSGGVDRKIGKFRKFSIREFHKESRTSVASRLL